MIQKLIRTEMNTREGLCPPRHAAWRVQTVWCASEVSLNSLLEEALPSSFQGFRNTGGWEARAPRQPDCLQYKIITTYLIKMFN